MGKTIVAIGIGLALGIISGFVWISLFPFSQPLSHGKTFISPSVQNKGTGKRQVVGFLPYWLLSKATKDYSPYLTTLTYFALRIDKDGSIVKKVSPTQYEPGWYALTSGKADDLFAQARTSHIALSLTIDSGNIDSIDSFISSASASASTLVAQIQPLLQQYGFSDLNLDIEYTKNASDNERKNFLEFVHDVQRDLPSGITLTVEVSPVDTIQKQLIDISRIGTYANTIILMAYDYHSPDSFVAGPVAPLFGAGVESEFDVTTAVDTLRKEIPSQKIVLGIPLYGYEWETLGTIPRSAIIPGSGVLASNNRAETLLSACQNCTVHSDDVAKESYLSFFSNDTHTNHAIFFPDSLSTAAKRDYAIENNLGGLALWALGYEGSTILNPLVGYKQTPH